jgi:hypothetical protein
MGDQVKKKPRQDYEALTGQIPLVTLNVLRR